MPVFTYTSHDRTPNGYGIEFYRDNADKYAGRVKPKATLESKLKMLKRRYIVCLTLLLCRRSNVEDGCFYARHNAHAGNVLKRYLRDFPTWAQLPTQIDPQIWEYNVDIDNEYPEELQAVIEAMHTDRRCPCEDRRAYEDRSSEVFCLRTRNYTHARDPTIHAYNAWGNDIPADREIVDRIQNDVDWVIGRQLIYLRF